MTKKEKFIEDVERICKLAEEAGISGLSADAKTFFESLKITETKESKKEFTENGKLILSFMKENCEDFGNLMKAKDIAEGLELSSRTVSGGMRKLVSDGYVEKMGESPICYSLTDKGKEIELN